MIDPQEFYVNQKVEKKTGYLFPGVVVSAYRNLSGDWRYVVECTAPEVAGCQHIYVAAQLRLAQ